MQSGSLAFRNGHRSWPTIRTVMLPYPPNTEIIARRIEAAIPPPFHLRSSSNASSQTLAKRSTGFPSIPSISYPSSLPPPFHLITARARTRCWKDGRKAVTTDRHTRIYTRAYPSRLTRLFEVVRRFCERQGPARLFSQSPMSRLIPEN